MADGKRRENADGTIFITSAKDTDKHAAKNALTMLQRSDANVLGCVMTKVDTTTHPYYEYYGYYE